MSAPKYAKDQPAGFINRIEKVAIVGAGGRIGSYLTKHLLATGKHTVTAPTRASSKSILPAGVRRVEVNYADESALVEALRGQDFLVITLAAAANMDPTNPSTRLIAAAAQAGVPYVMPNAYGPDPLNNAMGADAHLNQYFLADRAQIEQLGVSKWVVLATGFWYEWSLVSNAQDRFGCDVTHRKMTFFDDGEEKISTTTWDQCGRALAAYLSLKRFPQDEADKDVPTVERWANKALYVSSFRVSQKDMFESVKRVTGTTDADWTIDHADSKTRWEEGVEGMMKGDHSAFSRQLYTRIFFPTGEADHSRLGLVNEALGLPVEDMDESTKEGFRLLETGVLSM
ncbi:NAD(P)-binding protein [Cryphonectria parasitica EP155]|uniref:NAD(P)-binding protein n=1 Tax=Cryphonectria parasitica (strain ATCC 38755 / EP155) TaxID=660469 RepID=A0A9P5CK33_CRYP1|nr:NAD(P)-binding protein [Cryphonectria parasitica EP155]KAF3760757.1 NAD(P)-binding protein [Cryphonectria parasitica EP155]